MPDILIGGNHAEIEKWRIAEAEKRTETKRPDMYERYIESQFNEKREIYLDNSATTKQLSCVSDEMMRIYRYVYGNLRRARSRLCRERS